MGLLILPLNEICDQGMKHTSPLDFTFCLGVSVQTNFSSIYSSTLTKSLTEKCDGFRRVLVTVSRPL